MLNMQYKIQTESSSVMQKDTNVFWFGLTVQKHTFSESIYKRVKFVCLLKMQSYKKDLKTL